MSVKNINSIFLNDILKEYEIQLDTKAENTLLDSESMSLEDVKEFLNKNIEDNVVANAVLFSLDENITWRAQIVDCLRHIEMVYSEYNLECNATAMCDLSKYRFVRIYFNCDKLSIALASFGSFAYRLHAEHGELKVKMSYEKENIIAEFKWGKNE